MLSLDALDHHDLPHIERAADRRERQRRG